MATTHCTYDTLGRRVGRAASMLALLAGLGTLGACGYKGPLYLPPPPEPEPALTTPPEPAADTVPGSLEMPEPLEVPPPTIAPQPSTLPESASGAAPETAVADPSQDPEESTLSGATPDPSTAQEAYSAGRP